MKVTFDVDSITKIEKKKTIIDNVFGFTNEERNLLNHLFIIFLEESLSMMVIKLLSY